MEVTGADGVTNSESAKTELAKADTEELLSDVSSMENIETDVINGAVIEECGENDYIIEDTLSDVSISEILDGDLIIDEVYSDDEVCDELVEDSHPIFVPEDALSDISSACSISVSEGRRNSSRSKTSSKYSSGVDAGKTKTDKQRKADSSRRRHESGNTSISKSSSEKSSSSHRLSKQLPVGIIALKTRRNEYRCTACYRSFSSRRSMEYHLRDWQHVKRVQHIAAMGAPHLSSREKRKHEDNKESQKDTSKAKTKITEPSDSKRPKLGSRTENKESQKATTSTGTKQKDSTSNAKKSTSGKRQESSESKKSSNAKEVKIKEVFPEGKKPRLGEGQECKEAAKSLGDKAEKEASPNETVAVSGKVEEDKETEVDKIADGEKQKEVCADAKQPVSGKGQESKEAEKAKPSEQKSQKGSSADIKKAVSEKGQESKEAEKAKPNEKSQKGSSTDVKKAVAEKGQESKEAEKAKPNEQKSQKGSSTDIKKAVAEKGQESKEAEKTKPNDQKSQKDSSTDIKKPVAEKGQESKEAEKAKPNEQKSQKGSSTDIKKAVAEKGQESKEAEKAKANEQKSQKDSSNIKKDVSETQKTDKDLKKSSVSSEKKPKEPSSDGKKPRSERHRDYKESQRDKDHKESQKDNDHKDSQRDRGRKEPQRDKNHNDSQSYRDRKESQRDKEHKESQKDKDGKESQKDTFRGKEGKRKDRESQRYDTTPDAKTDTKKPRLEIETNSKEQKKSESRADPRVLRNLSDMKQPILGVEDISLTGGDGNWTYHCKLCSVACGSIDIRHHLRGKRHRLSYAVQRQHEMAPIRSTLPLNKGNVNSNRKRAPLPPQVIHQLEAMRLSPPRAIEDRNFRNDPPPFTSGDRSIDWKQAHWNDCCNSFLKITMNKPDITSRHDVEHSVDRSHKRFLHDRFSQDFKSNIPDNSHFNLERPTDFRHLDHTAQPHFLHPQHPANVSRFQEHAQPPQFQEHGRPPPGSQDPGQRPHFQEHGPTPHFQQPDLPFPPHFRQSEFPVPQQFLRPGFLGPLHFQRPGFQVPPQSQRPGFPTPQQFQRPEFPHPEENQETESQKNQAQQLIITSSDDKTLPSKPDKGVTVAHKPVHDGTVPTTDKCEAAFDIINSMIQNYLKNELQKLPSQLQKILCESTRNEASIQSTNTLSDIDSVENKLPNVNCSSKSSTILPTENAENRLSEPKMSGSSSKLHSDEKDKVSNSQTRVSSDDIASSFDQRSYRNVENVGNIPFLDKTLDSTETPDKESSINRSENIDDIQSFDQLSTNQRKDRDTVSSANKDEPVASQNDNKEPASATSTATNCFEQFINSWIQHTGAVPTRITESEHSDKLPQSTEKTEKTVARENPSETSNQASSNLSNVDHAELGRQVAAFLSKYSLGWSENLGNLLLGRNPENSVGSQNYDSSSGDPSLRNKNNPVDVAQYTSDHGVNSVNRGTNSLNTRQHGIHDMNMGSNSASTAHFSRDNDINSMSRGVNPPDAAHYIGADGRGAIPTNAVQYSMDHNRIRDENYYRRDPDNQDGSTLRNRANDPSNQFLMGSARDGVLQRSRFDSMVADNYRDRYRSEMTRVNIDSTSDSYNERNKSADDIRERQATASNYNRRGRGALPFRSAHKLSFLDLLNQHRNDPVFSPGFSRSTTSRRQYY